MSFYGGDDWDWAFILIHFFSLSRHQLNLFHVSSPYPRSCNSSDLNFHSSSLQQDLLRSYHVCRRTASIVRCTFPDTWKVNYHIPPSSMLHREALRSSSPPTLRAGTR